MGRGLYFSVRKGQIVKSECSQGLCSLSKMNSRFFSKIYDFNRQLAQFPVPDTISFLWSSFKTMQRAVHYNQGICTTSSPIWLSYHAGFYCGSQVSQMGRTVDCFPPSFGSLYGVFWSNKLRVFFSCGLEKRGNMKDAHSNRSQVAGEQWQQNVMTRSRKLGILVTSTLKRTANESRS